MANLIHNMQGGRRFHCFTVDGHHFDKLRNKCDRTSCFARYTNPHKLFSKETLDTLCQTEHKGKVSILKALDGHIVVRRHKKSGRDFVESFIRDPYSCKPVDARKPNDRSNIVCVYAIAHEPGSEGTPLVIHQGHEGILGPNEITLNSSIDHMIAKAAASIPLENDPRIIFDSPNLGSLRGVMLKGKQAHVIKSNFIKLVTKTKGENMYDIPIKMTDELTSALMLSEPMGFISVAKIQNGMIGYRDREIDNGKTFIFVCNSNDFFEASPTPNIAESTLQLFKMSYANPKKDGPRISIQISKNQYKKPPCKYNTPLIHLGMTVQDVLNVVEFACRNAMLDHLGCSHYPTRWKLHQRMLSQPQNDDQTSSDSASEEDEEEEEIASESEASSSEQEEEEEPNEEEVLLANMKKYLAMKKFGSRIGGG
jgi:hypothetical protein